MFQQRSSPSCFWNICPLSSNIFKCQGIQFNTRSRRAAIISCLATLFIICLSGSFLKATPQYCPAPPAGGKHHEAAWGGPRRQRPGPLPLGRRKGRAGRCRGEKREHGWRLHGGEGVPGGEREEPPFGRGGRQQRGRGKPGCREGQAHSSGGSMQGTDAPKPSLLLRKNRKQEDKKGARLRSPWLILLRGSLSEAGSDHLPTGAEQQKTRYDKSWSTLVDTGKTPVRQFHWDLTAYKLDLKAFHLSPHPMTQITSYQHNWTTKLWPC